MDFEEYREKFYTYRDRFRKLAVKYGMLDIPSDAVPTVPLEYNPQPEKWERIYHEKINSSGSGHAFNIWHYGHGAGEKFMISLNPHLDCATIEKDIDQYCNVLKKVFRDRAKVNQNQELEFFADHPEFLLGYHNPELKDFPRTANDKIKKGHENGSIFKHWETLLFVLETKFDNPKLKDREIGILAKAEKLITAADLSVRVNQHLAEGKRLLNSAAQNTFPD